MARFSRAALLAAAAIGLTSVAGSAEAAELTHYYELAGNAENAWNSRVDLTTHGGNFDGTSQGYPDNQGYNFGVNQGLSLPAGAFAEGADTNGSRYSIVIDFELDNVSNYRKIIDFKNLTADPGLYVISGALRFYTPTSSNSNAVMTANGMKRIVLTRDASSNVTAYVNGVQQFTFKDTGNAAVGSTAVNFFRDDRSGGEASAGFVERIAIYDEALSSSKVLALGNSATAVPEPAAGGLLAGAAALLLGRRRRRA